MPIAATDEGVAWVFATYLPRAECMRAECMREVFTTGVLSMVTKPALASKKRPFLAEACNEAMGAFKGDLELGGSEGAREVVECTED